MPYVQLPGSGNDTPSSLLHLTLLLIQGTLVVCNQLQKILTNCALLFCHTLSLGTPRASSARTCSANIEKTDYQTCHICTKCCTLLNITVYVRALLHLVRVFSQCLKWSVVRSVVTKGMTQKKMYSGRQLQSYIQVSYNNS